MPPPPPRRRERRPLLRRLAGAAGLPFLAAGCSPGGLAGALTPRDGTSVREGLPYGPGDHARLDLYLPPAPQSDTPLLVFFYGGGFEAGDRGGYAFLGRTLAARGLAVAVPDYRVFPAGRWPGFVEDGAAAVAWLGSPAAREAGVPQGGAVVLMGHSAGGFIAGALALDPRWLGGGRRAALAGCVTLAAPFEWTPRGGALVEVFADAPGGALRAAPLDGAALAEAPPMLLLHGAADRTVRPDQSERMAARLRAAGARDVRLRLFPGVGHIGILAALAAPVRALHLQGGPVLEEVTAFVAGVYSAADAAAGAPSPAASSTCSA